MHLLASGFCFEHLDLLCILHSVGLCLCFIVVTCLHPIDLCLCIVLVTCLYLFQNMYGLEYLGLVGCHAVLLGKYFLTCPLCSWTAWP
jgi:hypothetical protein